jgi:hypothetical protein
MHMHLVFFQVFDRDTFTIVNGDVVPNGSPVSLTSCGVLVCSRSVPICRPMHPDQPATALLAESKGLEPNSMDSKSSVNRELRTEPAMPNTAGAATEPTRGVAPSMVPTRRTPWADLLQRVFEVDALRCPRCGGRMRVLAAITEPDVARRILACLNLPTRAPPLATSRPFGPTRGWPEHEAPSATEVDAPWSAHDFDQSTPAEWDVGA